MLTDTFHEDDQYEEYIGSSSSVWSMWDSTDASADFSDPSRDLLELFSIAASKADDYDSDSVYGQIDQGSRDRSPNGDITNTEVVNIANDLMPWAMEKGAELLQYFYANADSTQPEVLLDSSLGKSRTGAAIKTESNVTIANSASDLQSGVNKDSYELQVDRWSNGIWQREKTFKPNPLQSNLTPIGPLANGLYRATVTAENGAGDSAQNIGFFEVDASNGGPDIGSISASDGTPARGEPIILTASDVTDSDGVGKVEFYHDEERNALNLGSDEFLGEGTRSGDDWSIGVDTGSLGIGTHRFYAVGYDSAGNRGPAIYTEVSVQNESEPPSADFALKDVNVSTSTVEPGDEFTIDYEITSPAPQSVLLGASLFPADGGGAISDPANDRLVNLSAGQNTISRQFRLDGGEAEGAYDLAVSVIEDADNNGQISGGDNTLGEDRLNGAVFINADDDENGDELPDLTISDVNTLNGPWVAGETVDVQYTIENTGSSAQSSSLSALWISKDGTIDDDADDLRLTNDDVGFLAANGGSTTRDVTVTLPEQGDAFWTGDHFYTIGVYADTYLNIDEQSEANNSGVASVEIRNTDEDDGGGGDDDDGGGTGDDGGEPNDSFATATDLGRIENARLNELAVGDGDVDYFKLETLGTGRLSVTAFGRSGVSGNFDLKVFDASRDQLEDEDGMLSPRDEPTVEVDVGASETFYVKVSGEADEYDLDIEGPEQSPGGAEDVIDLGTLASEYSDSGLSVNSPGDTDVFQVTAIAEGRLSVDAEADRGDSLSLEIYDSDDRIITEDPPLLPSRNEAGGLADVEAGEVYSIQITGEADDYEISIEPPDLPDPPEVDFTGNGIGIFDGDTTPIASDGTDLGEVIAGETVSTTFEVENDGDQVLNLSNLSATGPFEARGLTTSLEEFDEDEFTVELVDSSTPGEKQGIVSFDTNDPSIGTFDFTVRAEVLSGKDPAEIAVAGNGLSISDGDTTPREADNTAFGSAEQGQPGPVRTFTVTNEGQQTLQLGELTATGGFEVSEDNGLVASLAEGATDTFSIELNTDTVGSKQGEVRFANSDPNEAPYTFAVAGTVRVPEPTDTTAPTTTLTVGDITAAGASSQSLDVTFSDNTAVDVSTLDGSDLRVTGPRGFDAAASFVDVNQSSDGTPRQVTYRVDAPDSAWTAADNGTYTVNLQSNEVADTSGNFAAAGTLDSFSVNIEDTPDPDPNPDPEGDATVVGRELFYNNSSFDGNDTAVNTADDEAIATDKQALLPGQVAAFENYTSYSRGVNGVMMDVADLADAANLSADDFAFAVGSNSDSTNWSAAPAVTNVDVRQGAGEAGSDRVTLTWADGAIQDQWLKVTLKANDTTGLPENDVFYFGNTVGESGDSGANAIVDSTDEIGARNNPHSFLDPAGVEDPYDYNRDGSVDATDQIIARDNQTYFANALSLIEPTEQAGLASTQSLETDAPLMDNDTAVVAQTDRAEPSPGHIYQLRRHLYQKQLDQSADSLNFDFQDDSDEDGDGSESLLS